MLRVRWLFELSVFGLLGALAILVSTSFHNPAALILVVLVPLVVLALSAALGQGVRNTATLMRSWTWWLGLWVLAFLSGLTFRVRGAEAISEGPVDAWAAFRIALMAIVALSLFGRLALRKTLWLGSLFRGLVGALAIYCLISAISTVWSVYPAWTLYKSLEYLVDVALLAAILVTIRRVDGYKALFDWAWTLHGLLLVSAWLGVLLWPKEALMRGVGSLGVQLYGIVPAVHANGLGEYAATLAIVAFTRLLFRPGDRPARNWYWALFIFSMVTLVFSQARSALTGFLLGVALVLLCSKRLGSAVLVALGTLVAVSLTDFTHVFWTYFLRGEDPALFHSLTGRVNWWQFGWNKLMEQPLTGFGAYAAGRFAVMAQLPGGADTASTHNDYIEILVGTSFWGLVPIVICLLGAWWVLIRSARHSSLNTLERRLAVEAIGVLAIVSVRSFFSTDITWHTAHPFLVAVGYAEFLRRRRKYGSGNIA